MKRFDLLALWSILSLHSLRPWLTLRIGVKISVTYWMDVGHSPVPRSHHLISFPSCFTNWTDNCWCVCLPSPFFLFLRSGSSRGSFVLFTTEFPATSAVPGGCSEGGCLNELFFEEMYYKIIICNRPPQKFGFVFSFYLIYVFSALSFLSSPPPLFFLHFWWHSSSGFFLWLWMFLSCSRLVPGRFSILISSWYRLFGFCDYCLR